LEIDSQQSLLFLFRSTSGRQKLNLRKWLFRTKESITTTTLDKVDILLVGPSASAKTMFMKTLTKLQNSYFTDGGNSTKAGMIDYIFNNQPKYLLIDEIDKMSTKDQTFLLNLMETGIVSETKHGKTRTIQMKVWILQVVII
jgi:DNA replicative helicase MCM subunit Mcm2 (Cdc46/Mcm family)